MPDPLTPPLSTTELDGLRHFLHEAGPVLITSRNPEEWLGDLRRVEVDGLSADEAVLYADHLLEPFPEAGRRRESPAFAELMEWLDGHPLSMRLVLPHLATTGPAALLAGLRGAVPLPGPAGGDRLASLAASIGYSFERLPEADQRALVVVALFHGVVDANLLEWLSGIPDVLERVRGLTSGDWTRILDGAAAVGLLTRFGRGMYRIHPALPAFLLQRWRAEGSFAEQHAAALDAMLQTCSALADYLLPELSGGSARAGVLLTQVHARNLGSMLAHAIEQEIWDRAQCIAQTLDRYWEIRGSSEEAQGWADRMRLALEGADGSPPDLGSAAGRCWAFVVSAEAARSVLAQRIGQAHETYTALLDHLERQPPSPDRQRVLSGLYHQLGVVAGERALWDEAERWYRTSMAIDEERGERAGLGRCYHQLGRCAQERGRWKEAARWFRKALAIGEELGDRAGTAACFHQLGVLAQERERWDEAERWYRRSLAVHEDTGDRPHAAVTYHQLGLLAQERRRWAEAERWYLAALTVNEELDRGGHLVANYHQLGVMAVQLGRPQEAEQWFTRALDLARSLDMRADIDREHRSLDTLRRS
ncbi:tetratricopeptide repeat protein [Nonomuraea thailandensis]